LSTDAPIGHELVSIIIPTYNRPGLLRRALGTALGQTYRDIEVIVVDDCSKVDVASVIKDLGDPRVRLIRHEVNQGAPAARNTGIASAKGRYVAFLDDDDEWYPEKIEAQVGDLRAKGRYKVSFCLREFYWEGKEERGSSPPGYDGDHMDDLLAGKDISSTSCVLVERECLEAVGGFRRDLPCMQDWELWIRLAERYEFAYLNRVLLTKHQHKQARITGDGAKKLVAMEIAYQAHRSLFWDHRRSLARYLQEWASEAIWAGRTRLAKRLYLRSLIANPLDREHYYTFLLVLTGRYGG
jgi:glycosyltransferase involved in cell wall biosynthesis